VCRKHSRTSMTIKIAKVTLANITKAIQRPTTLGKKPSMPRAGFIKLEKNTVASYAWASDNAHNLR